MLAWRDVPKDDDSFLLEGDSVKANPTLGAPPSGDVSLGLAGVF